MNDQSLLRTSAALSIILSIATYYVWEVILGTFVWFFVAPSILAGAISLYQMIHLHVHATLHSGMKTIALWLFLECWHWTISGALLLWLILEVLGKIRGAGADYPTFVVILCIPQMLVALVEYRTLSTILERMGQGRHAFLLQLMGQRMLLGSSAVLSIIICGTSYFIWRSMWGRDVYLLMAPSALVVVINLVQAVYLDFSARMYSGRGLILLMEVLKGWNWMLSGGFLVWLSFEIMAKINGCAWGVLAVPIWLCVLHVIAALAEYYVLDAILEVMRQRGNVFTSEQDAEGGQGPISLPADR
jgi:hypothetical protein